jgi:hypothetical protein
MVQITVTNSTVIFEVLGLHKLWALKGRLEVPAARITNVRADPGVSLGWGAGMRFPGTYVPGRFRAGTYYLGGRRIFWDVARPVHAIVVELSGAPYDDLVIEVEDPGAAVRQLQDAMRRTTSEGSR